MLSGKSRMRFIGQSHTAADQDMWSYPRRLISEISMIAVMDKYTWHIRKYLPRDELFLDDIECLSERVICKYVNNMSVVSE